MRNRKHRTIKRCRVCGVVLESGVNIPQSRIVISNYICRECANVQTRDRRYRAGVYTPMSANKACALFLGVHVAERVLSHTFKDVKKMPMNNPGYDFICNRGKKIDVKSSCLRCGGVKSVRWSFGIKKNQIADYFLCLAFDNRESLNPKHIWLIPAGVVNHQYTVSIATTKIQKWNAYELDKVDDLVTCCETMRQGV